MLPAVDVPARRLDDYARDAGEDAVERLRDAAKPLQGARFLQINSTAYGGGVAELLATHVPLLNDLGIETSWCVIEGDEDFFTVTKSIHNALQGAEIAWTTAMEAIYWERIRANADRLDEPFDFVLVNDPQPAGLIRVLDDEGLRLGRWAWRCHIDLSTTNQHVWEFFEPTVNRYDAAIFTLDGFLQPGVHSPVIAFVPPSIDPTSEKNRPLPDGDVRAILDRYGVDPARPLVVQISRFDPWKDPLGVIDAFHIVRESVPDAQLVMAGSMAADDPEGLHYFETTLAHANGDHDVHLLTDADGVSHREVNAFQRAADVVVQKSTREGFGLVVSEGMWKGKPVVAGDVGGIRLQVESGVTGFLVGTAEGCGACVAELLRDEELARRMGEAGRARVRERFLSTRELEDIVGLLASLDR